MAPPARVAGETILPLDHGWTLAVTPAGACAGPREASALPDWIAAPVPGTAAQALEAAGRWSSAAPTPLHDRDVWYRLTLPASGRRTLRFEGLATITEGWLDDLPILASESMYEALSVEADIAPGATLWLCFRALSPKIASAKGARARWRPTMIEGQGLRFLRTTLLGHMSGWCPSIDIVGPWRQVALVEPGPLALRDVRLLADWDPRDGAVLHASLAIDGLETAPALACAGASAPMARDADGRFEARLAVPGARPWFPHTHGDQPLYGVTVETPVGPIALGRTGFRRIEVDRGADGRGFSLVVNGTPVFARGAAWLPPDLLRPGSAPDADAETLALVREAGMNMVRIPGVGAYQTRAFYDLAAEAGVMVWQDFMFANFDYPAADPAFAAAARAEAEGVLSELQGAPALAVLCGGSEVMQQAAMMGLPPIDWPLFDQVLPEVATKLRPDVPYVPNTPCGGPQPFAASEGVTHYYGVGAYERPLEDARRAEVRFAAECLAFANVPQPETLEGRLAAPAVHDPRWKARVPRDRGASWDFEDTRDHYLQRLYGLDPARLRREDPGVYLDLSRAVSAEVMAATFTEWRRPASPCAGALVWTLRDFEVGAGWGLIDALGEPKPAWYGLKRVLQPLFVGLTDEGVNGLFVHLANEEPRPFEGELRLAAFAETGAPLVEARRAVSLAANAVQSLSGFELLGRFFDLNYAYRFGPRPHAAVLAELVGRDGRYARAVHRLAPSAGLGGGRVDATLAQADGRWRLTLTSERLLAHLHIADRGFRPSDDGFVLLPGEPYTVDLIPRAKTGADARPEGEILAPGAAVLGGYGD